MDIHRKKAKSHRNGVKRIEGIPRDSRESFDVAVSWRFFKSESSKGQNCTRQGPCRGPFDFAGLEIPNRTTGGTQKAGERMGVETRMSHVPGDVTTWKEGQLGMRTGMWPLR